MLRCVAISGAFDKPSPHPGFLEPAPGTMYYVVGSIVGIGGTVTLTLGAADWSVAARRIRKLQRATAAR